jgi:integrase
MARALTDLAVRNLRPRPARYEVPDPGARGLYCVVQPSGFRGFAVRYRINGQNKKLTLKAGISLSAARKLCAAAMHDVAEGRDPSAVKKETAARAGAAKANTLQRICEEYLQREGSKLRTAYQRERMLERLVYPALGGRNIHVIGRSELIRLLDKIEDECGAPTADAVLKFLRRIFNWFAIRSEHFRSPVVKGMARGKPKETARARILSDDELRAVWKAAESGTPFGALVRFLLLTSARRAEAAEMTWSEINGASWVLPASRNKVKQELSRPLSKAAQAVLAELPRLEGCDFVFNTNGKRPLAGFSKFKRAFDQQCGVTDWVLHDLRRTARSLMSRAGVPSDHAERALGHLIPGIRAVYDRFEFQTEMLHAYEALAALIERVINPQ